MPPEGQVRRSCSCLGCRGSSSTRSSGELAARAAGNSALEGYGNQYWPICSSILAWRTPLPDREAWQATVHRVAMSRTLPKRPCACMDTRLFLPVAALPPRELNVKVVQLLGLLGSCDTTCAGTRTASAAGVMTLSEPFFELLVAGDQKASLASLSLQLCPFRHLRELLSWVPSLLFGPPGTWRGPRLGSYSVDQHIRHLKEHPE